jgi:hypothetical protein
MTLQAFSICFDNAISRFRGDQFPKSSCEKSESSAPLCKEMKAFRAPTRYYPPLQKHIVAYNANTWDGKSRYSTEAEKVDQYVLFKQILLHSAYNSPDTYYTNVRVCGEPERVPNQAEKVHMCHTVEGPISAKDLYHFLEN